MFGRNLLTHQKTLFKNGVLIHFFCVFVGLCILCVKIKTFLFEESILHNNKINCISYYPDHYLNDIPVTTLT